MASKQAGNAIVLILIAIFLFGALAAAFTRGMRAGQANLAAGQAKLIAEELLSYTKTMERSVDKLRSKGCSENELTVQSTGITGYTNPNTRPDGECDIFTGTNLNYVPPQTAWLDTAYAGDDNYGEYLFLGGSSVYGVGSGGSCLVQSDLDQCTDLLAVLRYIRKDVCIAINNILNIENPSGEPPVDSGFYDTKFIGSMAYLWGEFGDDMTAQSLAGHAAGCFYNNGNPSNHSYNFYSVLLAR